MVDALISLPLLAAVNQPRNVQSGRSGVGKSPTASPLATVRVVDAGVPPAALNVTVKSCVQWA